MKPSLYEQLALDRERAHAEVLKAQRRQRELARLRHELAGLQFDLAVLKLRRALGHKYRPDQPRVPAGQPGGGQWTDEGSPGRISPPLPSLDSGRQARDNERIILAGGFTKEQLNLSVQDFVAQNCEGRIRRELPGEFYGSTVGEVMAQARAGNSAARKCVKLLREDRFRK